MTDIQSKGQKTRLQILSSATDLASAQGLEGLTIGGLAKSLGLSKSGLFAHFCSKEELQLAVVDLARQRFEETVFPSSMDSPEGLKKLYVLLMSWVDSIENSNYRGGCFFAAASAEFDDRPGPVRDELARLSKLWINLLIDQTLIGQKLKQISKRIDSAQMVFELHAFVQEANWTKQLLEDPRAFDRARSSIRACLTQGATLKGKKLIPANWTEKDYRNALL
ncbi:Bacterial regulatory protein, tetR family [Gimesia panareensis]|uniref:Bacterial regulatory protein, tetR family n=1 Tax=Gimesia panareensis TaxID=2527978 RepID=A0A518FWJ2_9PLAN|nr:TetR/AcrR family transcriptional regulator [Gimesia panareensis]QDV20606.1 Bacterial regulatory protein, tetR family [Gimesia panareensis]